MLHSLCLAVAWAIPPATSPASGSQEHPLPDSAHAERVAAPRAADRWPAWRGPLGNGVAPAGRPPREWSEEKNVRWKVALPGLGSSTPVVWGERLYVTTAIRPEGEGGSGETEEGGGGGGRPAEEHEFAILCLDRATGDTVWSTTVARAVPHERGHPTASQASGSPLTDGEHVFAHFGSRGIHGLDLEGRLLWSRDLGRMRTRNGFGEGSSPALYGDTLVINWDHEGDSFLVALDKATGEERWRRARDEVTSWATPVIVAVQGVPQVIVPGTKASRAYDLRTGETLWSCAGMTTNCIPSPLEADGIVYLMSGFRGASLQAIRLEGAEGDLARSENLLWSHGRNTPYTPSGALYDGLLYFLRGNTGSLSCLDAASGEVRYESARLPEVRTVYSSVVAADGRVYVTSREGVTVVVAHGARFEVLAVNHLDDGFDASAVVVGNEMFLRGRTHLYCLAADA